MGRGIKEHVRDGGPVAAFKVVSRAGGRLSISTSFCYREPDATGGSGRAGGPAPGHPREVPRPASRPGVVIVVWLHGPGHYSFFYVIGLQPSDAVVPIVIPRRRRSGQEARLGPDGRRGVSNRLDAAAPACQLGLPGSCDSPGSECTISFDIGLVWSPASFRPRPRRRSCLHGSRSRTATSTASSTPISEVEAEAGTRTYEMPSASSIEISSSVGLRA